MTFLTSIEGIDWQALEVKGAGLLCMLNPLILRFRFKVVVFRFKVEKKGE